MGLTPMVAAEGASGILANALSDVTTVFNAALTMITGNEIAMVFVGIAVIGSGIGLFHRVIGH